MLGQAAMNAPRGIEQRLDWMLDHPPGEPGMCARETWQALGGDQNPPNPPAWGTPNANAVYDNVIAAGRYWTSTPIPRGAAIFWKYGNNGHAALSCGDGTIVTTDPQGDSGGTGIEPLSYPERWGATSSKRIWTDQYNGVRFDVGGTTSHGPVYLSKLRYGQKDSDSVRRLQAHLNSHPLQGGQTLQVTGNYLDDTDDEVRLCQQQHGFGNDPIGGSSVGPGQAGHLFAGCGCTITDDRDITEPPSGPEEPPVTASSDYWYSGKPTASFTFSDSYKKLDVDKWAPTRDGLIMAMLYANIDGGGEIRVRLIRDPDDATAYQTFYLQSGDNFLLTHVWFEMAEKNRKLWWEFCSMDGTTHTVTTRYAKFTTVG
jgi:hypothetical protein